MDPGYGNLPMVYCNYFFLPVGDAIVKSLSAFCPASFLLRVNVGSLLYVHIVADPS